MVVGIERDPMVGGAGPPASIVLVVAVVVVISHGFRQIGRQAGRRSCCLWYFVR